MILPEGTHVHLTRVEHAAAEAASSASRARDARVQVLPSNRVARLRYARPTRFSICPFRRVLVSYPAAHRARLSPGTSNN